MNISKALISHSVNHPLFFPVFLIITIVFAVAMMIVGVESSASQVLSASETLALRDYVQSKNWRLCKKQSSEIDAMWAGPSKGIVLTRAHAKEVENLWKQCLVSLGPDGLETQAKVLGLKIGGAP